MKYLSVCSGIEAATVAWRPLGFAAAAFAEIEAFPSAVLAHHYPTVPNHGDLTRFQEWPNAAVDVLVGGTPCQSFSVAGLRAGLADPRGNLALTYLAVADRFRPRWLVWENVPGVLSSNRGRDFGAFLRGLAELGYGFAYRVLDAQYFGLAQRRRRVFVVGHLGDWRRAAAVLFERESLSGHPAPRHETRQEVAGPIGAGSKRSGGRIGRREAAAGQLIPSTGDTAHYLNAGGMGRIDYESETLIAHSLRGSGFDDSEDGTGRGTPIIPLNLQVITRHESLGRATGFGMGEPGDPAFTLSKAHTHAIAFANTAGDTDLGYRVEQAPPITGRHGDPGNVMRGMQVRRLTPRECERLQGFPPDYTLIPYNGKPAKDGPRYKALGNSMAVPVMAWIGRRIRQAEQQLMERAKR